MKKTILITGGTGLIGRKLCHLLLTKGHRVHVLTRSKSFINKGIHYFHWDISQKQIDKDCFTGVDSVVHLAGASIAQRWTPTARKEIIDSRVQSARFLAEELRKHSIHLECFIGASASGFYEPNTSELLEEHANSGNGFLAEVCRAWEKASMQFRPLTTRHIIQRIGIVLAKNGGALSKMLPPFRFGFSPFFGDGKQFYPCAHVDDVANQMLFALETNNINGIYNTYCNNVRQKQLNQLIAKAMNKKVISIPAPAFALHITLGDMKQILLNSYQLSSKKIIEQGYKPVFTNTIDALEDILNK